MKGPGTTPASAGATALIVAAIPLGLAVTAREIQGRLPLDYSRSTIRAAMNALVAAGRAEFTLVAAGRPGQKLYRLCAEAA